MQLKDYAHYYIGKPCLNTWFTPDHDAYDVGWKLVGFNASRVKPFELENDTDTTCTDSIKLKLRRLESMTEEEAEQLALIYSGAKSVARTKGIASNWHYYLCYFGDNEEGELLIIAADGCAWYAHYFDKSLPGHRNIVGEHKAFHYLLQQRFDLFGLIDAGMAIDGKTV